MLLIPTGRVGNTKQGAMSEGVKARFGICRPDCPADRLVEWRGVGQHAERSEVRLFSFNEAGVTEPKDYLKVVFARFTQFKTDISKGTPNGYTSTIPGDQINDLLFGPLKQGHLSGSQFHRKRVIADHSG